MEKPVLIIAEAGVNHNGSLSMAKELIDCASDAGADIVKFQTFKADNLVTKTAEKAEYQKINTHSNTSQYSMLKELELSEKMHDELISYCAQKKIEFLSTPFDIEAAKYLQDKVQMWKIPSGELTNFPFLKFLASTNLPIVLSTGMATLDEVIDSVEYIKGNQSMRNITNRRKMTPLSVLHCTTSYPTALEDINLRAMCMMQNSLGLPIGLSDHSLGIIASLAAVAMGATIIEKHFTLDKKLPGPDHEASLDPNELKQLVKGIRDIELAFGSGIKGPANAEILNIKVARKSLYYTRSINRGEVLKVDDVKIVRPGGGMSPKYFDSVVGKKLIKNVEPEQPIQLSDFGEADL